MAFSKEEIDDFKRQFKQLKPGKTANFLYCPKGSAGDPVLMVNRRRIPSADIKALRKSAKEKRFIQGNVALSDDRKIITFTLKKKNSRLEKHVKAFYGKFLPKLKKARFELYASPEEAGDDAGEAAPGPFDALNTDAIKDELAGLRRQLEAAITKRLTLEPIVATLPLKERETSPDAVRLKEALAEENRLRALLDEGMAQLSQRTVEEMDDPDLDDVDADALSAQQKLADEATREARAAQAELAEKENRLKAIREKITSKGIEEARAGKARASTEIMQQLLREEAAMLMELTDLRTDVDDKIQQQIAERARSESMLDVWSEAQEAHWQQNLTDLDDEESWGAVQDADQRLAEALIASEEKEKAYETLEADRARLIAETDGARQDLAEDQAQVALLTRLKAELTDKINRAGGLTSTKGLARKLEEIIAELTQKRDGLTALEDAAEKLESELEASLEDIDAQLDGLDTDLSALWEQQQDARRDRDTLLLSDEEYARVDELAEAHDGALNAVEDAQEVFEDAERIERETLAQVEEALHARKAYEKAHKLLMMAKLKQKQLKEISSRNRIFRQSKGKGLIDEARGDLPMAELELEAALAAFENARQRLSDSEDAAATRMADAEEATLARIAAQETLAERKQELAQSRQRLAEEDSRVTGLIEDIARNNQADQLSEMIGMLPEDSPERIRVEHVKAQKNEAKSAATLAAQALMNHEMDIQDLQDEVAALSEGIASGETDAMLLKEKLLALSTARDTLLSLQDTASSTAAAHSAMKHDLEQARLEVAMATSESDDDEIRDQAEAFATARQHARDANESASRARNRDAAALHDLDEASTDLAEARRARNAATLNADLQDFISDSSGLIDRFHTLQEPDKNGKAGKTFDLMTEDGRKSARKSLGKADFQNVVKLQSELEIKAAAMIRSGASFEELTRAFSRVPNGLRPPSYRSEVAAFAKLEQAFQDIDGENDEQAQDNRILDMAKEHMSIDDLKKEASPMLKKLGMTWKEFYGKFNAEWEKSGIKAVSGNLLKADGSDASLDVLKSIQILGVAAHSMGVLTGATGLASHLTATEESDPINQKMHEDELMGKVSALFSSSIKLGRDATVLAMGANPAAAVLGTLHFSKELALHIMEVAARKAKSRWDGMLSQASALSGSPLASAFEESLAREKRLLTELGVEIGLDSVRIAASISQAFPPAAVFGIAAQLGAWATSKVSQELFSYHDAKVSQKSKELLDAARRGDDAAKTELFKNHPRYAKGLIAYMAFQEQDSFALTYTRSRGLADADIEKSSIEIISRYLLKQAKQTENMPDVDQFQQKWSKRLKTAKTVLIYSIPLVGQIKAAIDLTHSLLDISGKLDPAAVKKLEELEVLAGEVLNDRDAIARVTGRLIGQRDETLDETDRGAIQVNIDALGKLSEDYDVVFRNAITQATGNLDEIKQLSDLLDAFEEVNAGKLERSKQQELANARIWIGQLRAAEGRIVNHLARAAS